MQKEMEERVAARKAPALWERIRDSLIGVGIIALVAFLRYKDMLGENLFALGLVFGGSMVSKSLGVDFVGALIDKLFKK